MKLRTFFTLSSLLLLVPVAGAREPAFLRSSHFNAEKSSYNSDWHKISADWSNLYLMAGGMFLSHREYETDLTTYTRFTTVGVPVGLSFNSSLLGMLNNGIQLGTDRLRIADYELIGVSMGYKHTSASANTGTPRPINTTRSGAFFGGFELCAGGQLMFRASDAADIGMRVFYGAIWNSAMEYAHDEGLFLSPHIRFQRYYLEYNVLSKPKLSYNSPLTYRSLQFKKSFAPKIDGDMEKFLGLRVDFANGKLRNYGYTGDLYDKATQESIMLTYGWLF